MRMSVDQINFRDLFILDVSNNYINLLQYEFSILFGNMEENLSLIFIFKILMFKKFFFVEFSKIWVELLEI